MNKAIILAPWTVWYPGKEEPKDVEPIGDIDNYFLYLRELYFDGGYVELLHPRLYPEFEVIVDEDGHSKQLPINATISRMYGDVVVGPAVLLPKGTIK